MNFRQLARDISKLEGGKRNLNIADISEVLKCSFQVMSETEAGEVLRFISNQCAKYEQKSRRVRA